MKDKAIWIILILGLVFRLVNFERSFFFAHDQDLYSWIAKDIVVNHHQRLVGQITSVDGVFIGSFYYYLMAFFYAISGMNPLSAVVPVTLIGLFSIWSIYWFVGRHFGRKAGTVGAFIYAVSYGMAMFDKWSVPTQPTLIWSIWFVAVILELYKGNLKFLPLYGFLCGFVWQLHIALLPILPIPIIAYFLGNNNVQLLWGKKFVKTTVVAILLFAVTMSPFLLFELKHDFGQIKAMAVGINKNTGGLTGLPKLFKVVDASAREIQQRLWIGDFPKFVWIFWVGIVLSSIVLAVKKFDKKLLFLFGLWCFMIMLAQFTSKRVVSEYYFTNLLPMIVVLLAVFFDKVVNNRMLAVLGVFYLIINGWWLMTKSDYDQSFLYHRQAVEYIKNDVVKNNYPCVAVNYIADPGVGVGFRYLFWYYGIDLVKPGTPGAAVYNIPIPWQLSASENPTKFGRFGVLLPVATKTKITKEECKKPEYQLDPLLGYTD